MNRFRGILVLILFCIAGYTYAQQPPIQSLYMFDPLFLNPAYTGNAVQLSSTFINRNQWINLPGAPVTKAVSLHSGFFKSRVGVGVYMTHDAIGIHSDYSLYGTYAYKIKSKRGILSLGLQGGFHHLSSDFNKLNIRDPNDQILSGVITDFNPNFGVGVLYTEKDYFVGISIPYLLENSMYDVESVLSEATQSRLYYLQGGYTYMPSNNFKVKPSVLIRLQSGAPLNFDLNINLVYLDRIGFGASYRNNSSIIFLFELSVIESFHIGYAYDYTTSDLNKFSNGTHEIMLNYRVKLGKFHKGLECPTYF